MHKKFITGILAILIGSFFAVNSLTYSVGTTSNMGPGYYPLAISVIIISVGVIFLIKAVWTLLTR
jgi:hypothetical protein